MPNNNENAFVEALQRLINEGNLRAQLGKEALKIIEELSIEKIMVEWEKCVFI